MLDFLVNSLLFLSFILITSIILLTLFAIFIVSSIAKNVYKATINERQIISGTAMIVKGIKGVQRDINTSSKASGKISN